MPKTETKRKYGPSDTMRYARETDRERYSHEQSEAKKPRRKSYNPLGDRKPGILVEKLREKKKRESDI